MDEYDNDYDRFASRMIQHFGGEDRELDKCEFKKLLSTLSREEITEDDGIDFIYNTIKNTCDG